MELSWILADSKREASKLLWGSLIYSCLFFPFFHYRSHCIQSNWKYLNPFRKSSWAQNFILSLPVPPFSCCPIEIWVELSLVITLTQQGVVRPEMQIIQKHLCFCLVEDLEFWTIILHSSSHQCQHLWIIIGIDTFNIIRSMWSFPHTQIPWPLLRNPLLQMYFLPCSWADQLLACSSSLPNAGLSTCFPIKYCYIVTLRLPRTW